MIIDYLKALKSVAAHCAMPRGDVILNAMC
jgi:hypothetical protein